MGAVFRPKGKHSTDRSAGDRLRHRQKVRSSVLDNIADIIAEESIIGRSGDQIVKVPIRGIREYRFVYGENEDSVAEGGEDLQKGDVIGRGGQPDKGQPNEPGQQAGVDYYETDITLDELIDIMFEDLNLPDLERKRLSSIESLRNTKRKGYRSVGLRVRLDKKRTVRNRVKRQVSSRLNRAELNEGDGRIPFRVEDLTYKHRTTEIHRESNAVIICIMDTSGSMGTTKKYLARSFFFLLYQFVTRRYEKVEVVFIAHDIDAREVTEDEFFHKGESGGTFVSSGYVKALEVIADRYHPELWNIYAFHCSDGDNFGSDNPRAIKRASDLCSVCNLFGYGEIKPRGSSHYGSSLIEIFRQVSSDNFQSVLIEGKEDVWPCFKRFLGKEGQNGE
ncbi:MAG: YeaH/YhbH family protein [Candidatus Binatia bacterium]